MGVVICTLVTSYKHIWKRSVLNDQVYNTMYIYNILPLSICACMYDVSANSMILVTDFENFSLAAQTLNWFFFNYRQNI